MTNRLEEVERISDNLGLETSHFQQIDIIQLVTNPFNSVWTTVYQIRHDLYSMPAIFSCLADTNMKAKSSMEPIGFAMQTHLIPDSAKRAQGHIMKPVEAKAMISSSKRFTFMLWKPHSST